MVKKQTKIKNVAIATVAILVAAGAGAGLNEILDNEEALAIQVADLKTTINETSTEVESLNSSLISSNTDLASAKLTIEELEAREPVVDTIEVDNENLDIVLNEIYDNDGKVEYLTEDLDDDEIELIVDRISFVNEIKTLAVNEADKEIADLLDKEIYTFSSGNVTFDEDDIERVRVQDDADEVSVDIDFDDSDADVEVDVYFEQNDIKYMATVIVEIKDGEVDDIDLKDVIVRV